MTKRKETAPIIEMYMVLELECFLLLVSLSDEGFMVGEGEGNDIG